MGNLYSVVHTKDFQQSLKGCWSPEWAESFLLPWTQVMVISSLIFEEKNQRKIPQLKCGGTVLSVVSVSEWNQILKINLFPVALFLQLNCSSLCKAVLLISLKIRSVCLQAAEDIIAHVSLLLWRLKISRYKVEFLGFYEMHWDPMHKTYVIPVVHRQALLLHVEPAGREWVEHTRERVKQMFCRWAGQNWKVCDLTPSEE